MAQLRDITDFGSVTEIFEFCHSSNEPVFINRNGRSDMVAMSREVYDKILRTFEVHKRVAAALRDIENGNAADGNEVLKSLREKYGYTVNEEASGQTE